MNYIHILKKTRKYDKRSEMRAWTAADYDNLRLIKVVVAPEVKSTARKLYDKVKHHNVHCTDGNYSYDKVLPSKKHVATKSETCLVESFMQG